MDCGNFESKLAWICSPVMEFMSRLGWKGTNLWPEGGLMRTKRLFFGGQAWE
jgi:hypothetical protein